MIGLTRPDDVAGGISNRTNHLSTKTVDKYVDTFRLTDQLLMKFSKLHYFEQKFIKFLNTKKTISYANKLNKLLG